MKDNFSTQSGQYLQYRPAYPTELFDYLNSLCPGKQFALDCGTGNGQVAFELAKTFEKVFATDISQSQIDNALLAKNIDYSVQPAEKTNFHNHLFDLIVVAQAIHWFDFEKFYTEVNRVAKENALIVVAGYGRIKVSKEIDKIIDHFYRHIIGDYWDKERRYIDEEYQTIPFPFEEIMAPQFINKLNWTMEHFTGYLNTWSAVKHFIKINEYNPLDSLRIDIEKNWGRLGEREIQFPILLRIGRVRS